MLPGLRTAYLAAAVLLLLALPVTDSSEVLALFVAVDLAAAALFLSKLEPKKRVSIVAIGDNPNLPLLRRTLPQLRGRRPVAVIEAQVSWRQAAEFRRRRQELAERNLHQA